MMRWLTAIGFGAAAFILLWYGLMRWASVSGDTALAVAGAVAPLLAAPVLAWAQAKGSPDNIAAGLRAAITELEPQAQTSTGTVGAAVRRSVQNTSEARALRRRELEEKIVAAIDARHWGTASSAIAKRRRLGNFTAELRAADRFVYRQDSRGTLITSAVMTPLVWGLPFQMLSLAGSGDLALFWTTSGAMATAGVCAAILGSRLRIFRFVADAVIVGSIFVPTVVSLHHRF